VPSWREKLIGRLTPGSKATVLADVTPAFDDVVMLVALASFRERVMYSTLPV
jgi:hypothetical protein